MTGPRARRVQKPVLGAGVSVVTDSDEADAGELFLHWLVLMGISRLMGTCKPEGAELAPGSAITGPDQSSSQGFPTSNSALFTH